MAAFLMPSLGADMEAGTLVEWLKKPGEDISRGDIIAVVETQKGAIEIESFQEGVLQTLLVEPGTKVPVGAPLAMIGADAAEPPAVAAPVAEPEPPAPPQPAAPVSPPDLPQAPQQPATPTEARFPTPAAAPPVSSGARMKITPAARRLAETQGLDYGGIQGSGPEGAIVLADITSRLGTPQPQPVPGREPAEETAEDSGGLTGMRAAIAAAMTRSKREIPHYYLAHTVDLTAAEAFVSSYNDGKPPAERILLAALYVKAVALAAAKYKAFNGHFENGRFTPSSAVHAGFAINLRGGGLVAPALHNAEASDIAELMARMRDLIARVRAGRFRSTELSDPTITISSLGDRGVELLYGVIYPPQVAIIGFGMPCLRAWARDDRIEPRRVCQITLAADHRLTDGHAGAAFLNDIAARLQEPETL
jgi:pyruvate dehydrogenase E2 component (dihydrolipoamide acetyltransferase)